jgi:hypothetical protein
MDPDIIATRGIAPQFTQEKLRALLTARIDFHLKEVGRLEPEVPKLKDALALLETQLTMARDSSEGAMERLEAAQNAYMSAAFSFESHRRWAAFLTFHHEHLAPGTHVLELADLRTLDLVENPADIGYAMVPQRDRHPMKQLVGYGGKMGAPLGFPHIG